MTTSNAFLTRIEHLFLSMSRYEDKQLQTKARSLIPVTLLELRAQEKMRLLQFQIKKGEAADENISIQELVLLELLAWFKTSFFEWIDNPDCDYCLSETKFSHMNSDPQVVRDGNVIEMHRCVSCDKLTPFYRYDKLEILLETREGRCGEWAKVFTLFCRTFGWDARLVIDETDHVWTEVYSISQKRWLHCDACENICDNPLIYEKGWGKKLSYVIAYSSFEVQDVTWRYSTNHSEVLKNRKHCSEQELIKTIIRLRNWKQFFFSVARRKYLTKRLLDELVELMIEKSPTSDKDIQGRTSGSLSWRLQRGETKFETVKIWSPTADDLTSGQMIIRYNPILDKYERIYRSKVVETVSKWQNGVFSAKNILRKEETDWKFVYLCREETAANAEIQWRFDTGTTGKTIDKVLINFDTQTFETGLIKVKICGNNQTQTIDLTNSASSLDNFRGSTTLTITALLSGGTGSCAWQHSQLFRRPFDSTDFPFVVAITLK